VGLMEQNGY
jgi:hypothetical protein